MNKDHEKIDAGDLFATIRCERRVGVVRAAMEDLAAGPATPAVLDAFVARHGMTGIGADWVEVPYAAAMRHLTAVLHRDMAYGSELIPRERAGEHAVRFFRLFPEGRFFTNTEDGPHEHPASGPWGWGSSPLTQATFDTGVLAVSEGHIGILWVEDED